MHDLIRDLTKNGVVVTDGAWGTQLQIRGLPIGECPDLWNLSSPKIVEEVASLYVKAGSHIILTNTFGSSRIALSRYDMGDKAIALNKAGAEISKKAAGYIAKVFASIGPCGKMLAMGEVTEEEMFSAFSEQAKALAEGGADGIVIETMSDLEEARIAVRAAKETGLPVVASMAFDSGKAADRTMMGVTPEQAVKGLTEAGADVIGANCGRGPEGLLPVCQRLKAASSLPIWIKPNAGLPEMVEGHTVCIYRTTPDEFAEQALKVVQAGASFIGGCCGTGPAFIRALCNVVK
jgi:methionine synthase I (cobalamin-dependent)